MAARFRQYQSVLRMLKIKCPAAFPVSVRRVNLSKTHVDGRCWKHGKKFFIQIERSLNEHAAIDVLLHEWAHARAWNHRLDAATTDEEFNKLAHDAVWGVAYAEIYSLFEREFTGVALL